MENDCAACTFAGTQVAEAWPLDTRPEYVRVQLQVMDVPSVSSAPTPAQPPAPFRASRTGGQLSSRLMSMRSANGLLILPARTDSLASIAPGMVVPALVIGPLFP